MRPGCVLVEVGASSVNPVDYKIRQGFCRGPELPGILHGEWLVRLLKLAKAWKVLRRGRSLWLCGRFKGLPGVLSEYALADARLLSKKPSNLSMVEAATLPLVGITAWNALIDRAEVASGQKVLVHASCGGVGHIGLQLAKAFGAEVHATASDDRKIGLGFELGADRMINYKQTDVDAYVPSETDGKGYDAVFDTVGESAWMIPFRRPGSEGRGFDCRPFHHDHPVHVKSLSLHVVFMLLPILRAKAGKGTGKSSVN